MGKYSFLGSNISLVLIGLLLGLFSGFKIANSQYRGQQSEALNRQVAQATGRMSGASAQSGEVAELINKAKANPNDVEAQMDAASQFIQIERPREAMPFLLQADKAKPDDARINAALGLVYFMLGQMNEATDHLKRSRALGATEPSVTSLLIGAYVQTGKNLDEADRLLKELEAKGLDPIKLAQIRADLNAVRANKVDNQGAPPGSKTMLDHGPESKSPQPPGGKN